MRQPLLERERSRRSLGPNRLPFKLNVRRLTSPWRKAVIFFGDIFQSMVDLPTSRFLIVFVLVYLGQYFAFGLVYFHQSESCIEGVEVYLHAVWFSVQTARTIGYGSYGLAPNPACTLVNVYVMLQTVVATFLDTLMFGVVFTRFSNPMLRQSGLQHSSHIVLVKRPFLKGFAWCLTCRVANIRSHGLLTPSIKMLCSMLDSNPIPTRAAEAKFSRNLTVANLAELGGDQGDGPDSPAAPGPDVLPPDSPTGRPSFFGRFADAFKSPRRRPAVETSPPRQPADNDTGELQYTVFELGLPGLGEEINKMTLGFPCSVTHVIDRSSPLFGLSIEQMEEKRVEIFVIIEGIDPATSNAVRGIKTYTTADFLMNRVFSGLLTETKSGRVGLKLNDFDQTAASEAPSPSRLSSDGIAGPSTSEAVPSAALPRGLKRAPTGAMPSVPQASDDTSGGLPSRYEGYVPPILQAPPHSALGKRSPPMQGRERVHFAEPEPEPRAPGGPVSTPAPSVLPDGEIKNRLQLLMAALLLEDSISEDARASIEQFTRILG